MPVYRIAELSEKEPFSGVRFRVIPGQHMTVSVVELAPGATVPEHAHPQEQVSTVLEGEMSLTLEGKTYTLRPGMVAVIPPQVPHAAQAGPQGARVMDVFSPPREDLVAQAQEG